MLFIFLLELEGRDPYIVAPAIAKAKEEEDVIRPDRIGPHHVKGWNCILDPGCSTWTRASATPLSETSNAVLRSRAHRHRLCHRSS